MFDLTTLPIRRSKEINGCYGDRRPAACAATIAHFRTQCLAGHFLFLLLVPTLIPGRAAAPIHNTVLASLSPCCSHRLTAASPHNLCLRHRSARLNSRMPSDKNPFRQRAASSSATGSFQPDSGGTSDRRRSPSICPDSPERLEDPECHSEPPPLPPRGSRSEPHLPTDDLISEDLPPAYTPAPDVLHGEATIELGPRRPFQQPQAVPQYLSPTSAGWPHGHRPSASVVEWGQYPAYGGAAIPRHSSSTRDRPRTAPGDIVPPGPLSDFARDFYTASSPTAQTGVEDEDDGRPTATPKPGHPLMRNGRVLVYPASYECRRCTSAELYAILLFMNFCLGAAAGHNVGYRNNDPTSPCFKCWERYARPFAGPLTTINWKGMYTVSNAPLGYQRPLPRFTPPHMSGMGMSAPASRSSSHAHTSGYSGSTSSRILPVASGSIPMGLYLDSAQGRPGPAVRVADHPPPGAMVFRPGDPRLGGRLCWRCGGSGVTTFLIFDEQPCSVCDGIGRTYL